MIDLSDLVVLTTLSSEERDAAVVTLAQSNGDVVGAFASAVRAGYLAVESLRTDLGLDELRRQVVAVNVALADGERTSARLAALPDDLAIVPFLAGTHDPARAIERLAGDHPHIDVDPDDESGTEPEPDDRVAIEDGFVYARGFTVGEVWDALTRTAG